MDTRLKNSRSRHWIGVLLIVILVIVSAAATVGFYPYMKQKAVNQSSLSRQEWENDTGRFDNLATQVMNFSYVIWHQQKQEEKGGILTYSQTFLPGLDEKIAKAEKDAYMEEDITYEGEYELPEQTDQLEMMHEAQSQIEELGRRWEEMYERYNGTLIRYMVTGPDGQCLRSNVIDAESVFSRGIGANEIRFTAEFASGGRLSISDIAGDGDSCSRMFQSMTSYEFYDPIETRLGSQYRSSGVEFQGPKDMKIHFICDLSNAGSSFYGSDIEETGVRSWDYQSGGGYFSVVCAIAAVITLTALALPGIRSLEIGRSALCRLSFEPLCASGTLWFATVISSIPVNLIHATMEGRLSREWLQAGFTDGAAHMMTLLINVMFWIIIYGILYWGITCIRAVFTLGLWRYFKERTWLGRFLRFCKRWTLKGLDLFSNTDWEGKSTRIIGKAVIANFIILALISCLWFWGIGALVIYSLVLFFLFKKYWGKMEEKYQLLLKGINAMAEGNLDVEFDEDLGIFEPLKEQLSHIRDGFKKAVAQEVKSERTKSELITNVSHDLKTPLTAIITYINLLKQENLSEEERSSYIQVLDRKAMRLKELIEDLFEVSKANSGTVTLHLEEVEIVSLLKQVRCELADKIEKSGVDFRFQLPEEKIYLHLDGQKTCRIFENLMVNITKYAMKGTRAYIQIGREENGYVAVSMRNISEHELTVSPDELTERFVRGDESRNTEGSGLGLAIARSFTEAQGGTMKLEAEDDLFKVTVRWKEEKMEKPPVHTEPVEEADPLKSADLQPVDPQVSDLQPVDPQVSDVQPVSSQPSGLQPSGSRPPVPASFTWWDPEKNEMLEEQEEEKETDEP